MDIPFGRFRLSISVACAGPRRKGWEELAAVGMDDLELARLNQLNTRDPLLGTWPALKLSVLGRTQL